MGSAGREVPSVLITGHREECGRALRESTEHGQAEQARRAGRGKIQVGVGLGLLPSERWGAVRGIVRARGAGCRGRRGAGGGPGAARGAEGCQVVRGSGGGNYGSAAVGRPQVSETRRVCSSLQGARKRFKSFCFQRFKKIVCDSLRCTNPMGVRKVGFIA